MPGASFLNAFGGKGSVQTCEDTATLLERRLASETRTSIRPSSDAGMPSWCSTNLARSSSQAAGYVDASAERSAGRGSKACGRFGACHTCQAVLCERTMLMGKSSHRGQGREQAIFESWSSPDKSLARSRQPQVRACETRGCGAINRVEESRCRRSANWRLKGGVPQGR